MADDVTLLDAVVYDPDTSGEITLRYSDNEGFDPGTDSIGVYEPRLIDPGSIEEYLFARGTTVGLSETSKGRALLNNADGALDGLRNYGFGRAITIRRGDITSTDPGDLTTIFTGVSQGRIERTELEIGIDVKNKLAEFYDLPYAVVKYDGDTSDTTYGSGGHVNGTEDDLKGKNRPYLLGNGGGENFVLPLVNSSKQTFQISQNEITSITTIWNGGAAQTQGSSHASLTALQAATVTSGQYDYYLGDDTKDADDPARGAYIRIGGTIDGDVTCKAVASSNNLVQCIKEALEHKGAAPDATTFTAMASTFSAAGGIYIGPEEVSTGDVVQRMLEGFSGYLYITAAGTIKIGYLTDPSAGSSVATIEKEKLLGDEKVRRFPSGDDNGDMPASQVIYNYNYNYAVQGQADVPGATSAARIEFLKHEWRTISKDAAAVVTTKHPKAIPVVINSLITSSSAADTEAARQKTLRTTEREFAEITVHEKFVRDINLGDVITVEDTRYSDTGTEKWLVLGRIWELAENEITFILWK